MIRKNTPLPSFSAFLDDGKAFKTARDGSIKDDLKLEPCLKNY